MQAVHVTVACICLVFICVKTTEAKPCVTLKSEYRHDALDYGSDTSWFFRQKMQYVHGNTLAGGAVTRKSRPQQYSMTGCAVFSPVVQSCLVTTGHFYTSFGAGLLIGRGNSFNPDPFSTRPMANPDRSFVPCLSGNPEYAFRGLGLSMCTPGDARMLDLNTFYSIQQRYTTDEYMNNGTTTQSINSLLSRTRKKDKYTQPVTIHTSGLSLSCHPGKYLLLQANYYTSKLVYDGSKTMEWNSEEDEFGSSSVRMLKGTGYYACYRDDFVTAFVEHCFTYNRINRNGEPESPSASGIVTGTRYRGSFMEMHVMYKKTDPAFVAPFGNALGSDNPEEVFSLRFEIEPVDSFQTGISIEDENSLSPSSYYDEYPHVRKRSMFFTLDQNAFSVNGDIARCDMFRSGENRYYTRQKLQYCLSPGERISLDGKTMFQQRRNSGYSWLDRKSVV